MFFNSFTNINFGCSNFTFGNFGFPNFGLNNFNITYNNLFITNNFSLFQPSINNFNMSFSPNFTQSFNSDFSPNFNIWTFSNTSGFFPQSSIFTTCKTTYQPNNITSSYERKPQSSTHKISSSRGKTQTQTQTSQAYTGALSQYNSEKGNKLAEIAMKNAGYEISATTKKVTDKKKNPQKFTKACARYVQTSITDAGLDDNIARVGSAYQITDSLRKNSNFTEISASTNLKDLPPGAIIIYNRGAQGYSSEHGHVEIITKDGRAVSDGITDYLYRKPSHIFIPV